MKHKMLLAATLVFTAKQFAASLNGVTITFAGALTGQTNNTARVTSSGGGTTYTINIKGSVTIDAVISAIDPELIGAKKVVRVEVVVVDQLDRLSGFIGAELIGLLIAHPGDPFGVVAFTAQSRDDGFGAITGGDIADSIPAGFARRDADFVQ